MNFSSLPDRTAGPAGAVADQQSTTVAVSGTGAALARNARLITAP